MSQNDDSATDKGGQEVEELMTPSERRGGARHFACFPAHLETGEGVQRTALIRDLSVSGALLLTRAKLAMGDQIRLSLYLKEGMDPIYTTASVVREERRSMDLAHPWTKAVAVRFEVPIVELEVEAKALADHQALLAAGRRGPESTRAPATSRSPESLRGPESTRAPATSRSPEALKTPASSRPPESSK